MMADMGETELTPMVAVDPFHLPQSEPLALTVNNKEKESSDLNEFRQEQEEEEEEEVNFKQSESEKKTGFTFTVADDTGENQPFTLQVPLALSLITLSRSAITQYYLISFKVILHGAL